MRTKAFKVCLILTLFFVVATFVATEVSYVYSFLSSTFLGGETRYLKSGNPEDYQYYTADYSSKAEVLAAANALNETIVEEGITLLKNEGNVLPLNKENPKEGREEYQTLVHNLARIFAISATTQKFEQCSAFLNYQSTNSSEILEMYYKQNLVAAVNAGDAAKHNVKMLAYIRNHVRDCFDKTYEDVISNYQLTTDAQASSKRWHSMLYTAGYMVQNMDTLYKQERGAKQALLETVLAEWAKLK